MKPNNAIEERDYLISQYVDGTLDDATRDEVQSKIASDPEWEAAHRRCVQVHDIVCEHGVVTPDVDYDAMRKSIAMQRQRLELLIRRRKMVIRLATPLAAAASIAIVLTVYLNTPTNPQNGDSIVGIGNSPVGQVESLTGLVESGWGFPVSGSVDASDVFVSYGSSTVVDDGDAVERSTRPVVAYSSTSVQKRVYTWNLSDIRRN